MALGAAAAAANRTGGAQTVNAKTVLLRVAQIALVLLVTWGIVRALAPELTRVSLHDVTRLQPAWWRIGLSLVVLLAFYLLHAWLWRHVTQHLAGQKFPYRQGVFIYYVSGLGRYIPGRVWQIAGMAVLAQRAGISPVAATTASIIAQLAFTTTGLVYAALLVPQDIVSHPLILAAIILAVLWVLYLLRHAVGRRVSRARPVIEVLDRLGTLATLRWWVGYGLSWIVLTVAFVLLTTSFVTLGLKQQLFVAGTVVASYLGGQLAFFSVAGLGVREALMGSWLATVMSPAAAVVVTVASRIWFTAGELLPILFGKRSS